MPTYEYECTACKHKFDRFESIKAAPNNVCEKCHKKKAIRKISGGGGFLFKGTGFYITDYKKGGSGAPKEENKPAAAAGATDSVKGGSTSKEGSSKSSDSSSTPAKAPESTSASTKSDSGNSSAKSKKPNVA